MLTLAALTREAVLAAIEECDRSGREAFLAWHGFGRSAVYSLEYRGRRYPSKAVAGVALGLESASFSGGAEHSARALVRLGFRVRRGGRLLTRHDVDLPRRVSLGRSPELRLYVCRPTGERAIEACKHHGFGTMLSPLSVRSSRGGLSDMSGHVVVPDGLPYVIDNGAWSAHCARMPWSEAPFVRLLERTRDFAAQPGWVVLPDLVGAGPESLARSLRWHEQHGELAERWLLAVQDGMSVAQVRKVIVDRNLAGIFVGGSTAWKWEKLPDWAELALDLGVVVHVGRVNSLRRAELCRDLGVTSIDGSSVSRFAVNAAKMARPCDGDDRPTRSPRVVERARRTITEMRAQTSLPF